MRLLIGIFTILLVYSCSNKYEFPLDESLILAKVGSKYITIQDFIRRSEYSIRPDYCKRSNYIHKKIILNSLIAEKMIALEMENFFGGKFESKFFNSFLKGRKEQSMRQLLYNNNFMEKIVLENEEVNQYYKFSSRTVELDYINLPDLDTVEKIQYLISENISLDSIYQSLWEGETPKKSIKWIDREPDEILESIFKDSLKIGQIIGPLETEEKNFLIMQITGWIDQPAITENQRRLRFNDVSDKLKEKKAQKAHSIWVKNLMSKKNIKFNKEIFQSYAKFAGDYYLRKDSNKKEAINKVIWDQVENLDRPPIVELGKIEKIDLQSIIFNYNNRDWTIESFNKALLSHPLVFRKKKMGKSEFPNQLRLAIADLLTDLEINKKCYEEGFDKNWVVKSNVGMWKDAYLTKKYLEIKNLNKLEFLNNVVDSLQLSYSDKIEINTVAFENIELTSTDMMVTQEGVPYPIVVPSFPLLTDDSKLNYGMKMDLLGEN